MSWRDTCDKWLDDYGALEQEAVWQNGGDSWHLALAILEAWVRPLYYYEG